MGLGLGLGLGFGSGLGGLGPLRRSRHLAQSRLSCVPSRLVQYLVRVRVLGLGLEL